MTSDVRSIGRAFDSRSARHQMVTTWMNSLTVCVRTGKPSRYVTNTKINSVFRPSGVGKLSTGFSGGR